MPLPPFTHHEILSLVEPFTRRGRHVDLAGSNRLDRRLLFKPIDHPASGPDDPGLREVLHLDNPYGKTYQLTRVLTQPGGLEARLEAEGTNPAELLAEVEAIPLQHQFAAGPGFRLARSYQLPEGRGEPLVRLVMTRGVIRADSVTLTLKPSEVKGFSADVELATPADDPIVVPEDLLAVLGWDWSPIRRDKEAWRGKLRLRGAQPGCSRRAEAKLALVAAHLAQTLAEPPARFHERHLGARWGVALRRAIPLLTAVGLLVGSAMLAQFDLDYDPVVRMMIMNSPPLLLAFAFSLQELPRFEIPPLPRASRAAAWREPPTGSLASQAQV